MYKRIFVLEKHRKGGEQQAARYGEKIVLLFKPQDQRPSIWSREFVEEAMARLKEYEFDPNEDAFLVSGSFVPIARVITAMAVAYVSFNALLFSATTSDYVSRRLGAA